MAVTSVKFLIILTLSGLILRRTLFMSEHSELRILRLRIMVLKWLILAGTRLMEMLQCLKIESVWCTKLIWGPAWLWVMPTVIKLCPLAILATTGLVLFLLVALSTTALGLRGVPAPPTISGTFVLCIGNMVLLRRMSVFTHESLCSLLQAMWVTGRVLGMTCGLVEQKFEMLA